MKPSQDLIVIREKLLSAIRTKIYKTRLSQKSLAPMLKMTQPRLSNLMNDQPDSRRFSTEALLSVCAQLGIKVELIVSRKEETTQLDAFTWDPKSCPCGSVQQGDCRTESCKWTRDPSLVPQSLRLPVV